MMDAYEGLKGEMEALGITHIDDTPDDCAVFGCGGCSTRELSGMLNTFDVRAVYCDTYKLWSFEALPDVYMTSNRDAAWRRLITKNRADIAIVTQMVKAHQ